MKTDETSVEPAEAFAWLAERFKEYVHGKITWIEVKSIIKNIDEMMVQFQERSVQNRSKLTPEQAEVLQTAQSWHTTRTAFLEAALEWNGKDNGLHPYVKDLAKAEGQLNTAVVKYKRKI